MLDKLLCFAPLHVNRVSNLSNESRRKKAISFRGFVGGCIICNHKGDESAKIIISNDHINLQDLYCFERVLKAIDEILPRKGCSKVKQIARMQNSMHAWNFIETKASNFASFLSFFDF